MKKENLLENFIKLNNLEFVEGVRNSNLTVLCGYALYINKEKADVCEAIPEDRRTGELGIELERVWDYAEKNNYGKWWEIEYNRNLYKLSDD
jgi:hypothetical protein